MGLQDGRKAGPGGGTIHAGKCKKTRSAEPPVPHLITSIGAQGPVADVIYGNIYIYIYTYIHIYIYIYVYVYHV